MDEFLSFDDYISFSTTAELELISNLDDKASLVNNCNNDKRNKDGAKTPSKYDEYSNKSSSVSQLLVNINIGSCCFDGRSNFSRFRR